MALDSFNPRRTLIRGGITKIALIPMAAISEITYDIATDSYSDIYLEEGITPAIFGFPEDQAQYSQTLSANGGEALITHKLSFTLYPANEATEAMTQLAQNSNDGMAAFVVTRSGKIMILGYSRRFAKEQPLRMATATATTGSAPEDTPVHTIVLTSVDCSQPKCFTGTEEDLGI